jgi:hypothetical protein
LPIELINRCEGLARRANLASQKNYFAAERRTRGELAIALEVLEKQLRSERELLQMPTARRNLATPLDIYHDLVSLFDEFPFVTWCTQEKSISATTERIVLDGVDLGPFTICLHWDSLDRSHAYQVSAVEPNPAASDQSITHPHVQDGNLCEGDGRSGIKQALAEGRLLDFFLIVRSILTTYNSFGAYVNLERWHGVHCDGCGDMAAAMSWMRTSSAHVTAAKNDPAASAASAAQVAAILYVTNAVRHAVSANRRVAIAAKPRASTATLLCVPTATLKGGVLAVLKRKKRRTRTSSTRCWRPTLRFNPAAWAKLVLLRDAGQTEIGGFGISSDDDPLLVIDVDLVRQVCTSTSVSFRDEAVADYLDKKLDQGIRPAQCMRVWLHTHPADSATPSPLDEQTFARVFERCDWAVMFILAKAGSTYARLRFASGPVGQMRIRAEVDFSQPFAASAHARWLEEYYECVQVRERAFDFARNPFYAEPPGTASGWRDPYPLEDVDELPF